MQNKKKLKQVYRIFSAIFVFLFIMITCPPIVRVFDRNDIWVGIMPLSQFYILIVPLIAAITMAVLYFIDAKYSKKEITDEQEVTSK